ncbi:PAAR domain-containing protein [Duganella sp. LjRoot269]|uniref:PAAR domain-containing protein n=1 Tax=Duganella sp. LjRoot269 TaxID=3342305 RepID=UPI003ECF8333
MPEIIRKGDSTSHGGTVLEGSPADICMGQPIAYIGHKVHCPKCRGDFPIVEGVMTATFYGQGVAVAGMKTSCGATLIASQFTDTIEWSSGASGSSAAKQSAAAVTAITAALAPGALPARAASNETPAQKTTEKFDEQPQLQDAAITGIPYFVETKDGRTLSGRATADGVLPRIETYDEEEYTVYWGDDALARISGAI